VHSLFEKLLESRVLGIPVLCLLLEANDALFEIFQVLSSGNKA
jgi:hypothetical protein